MKGVLKVKGVQGVHRGYLPEQDVRPTNDVAPSMCECFGFGATFIFRGVLPRESF